MMKLFITSLLLIVATISGDVSASLNTGDAKVLSSYFHGSVELSILDEESVYSKTQAEQILKKFFKAHPVTKYESVHVGNAKDGSAFEIGNLVTKGATYRTYFLLKGNGSEQKIHQFRIEDE
jgi:hypothetical protein